MFAVRISVLRLLCAGGRGGGNPCSAGHGTHIEYSASGTPAGFAVVIGHPAASTNQTAVFRGKDHNATGGVPEIVPDMLRYIPQHDYLPSVFVFWSSYVTIFASNVLLAGYYEMVPLVTKYLWRKGYLRLPDRCVSGEGECHSSCPEEIYESRDMTPYDVLLDVNAQVWAAHSSFGTLVGVFAKNKKR